MGQQKLAHEHEPYPNGDGLHIKQRNIGGSDVKILKMHKASLNNLPIAPSSIQCAVSTLVHRYNVAE